MARKVYHVPLRHTLGFIETHKSNLNKIALTPHTLEYDKLLGKSYYTLEVETFINFFKIDKEPKYALSTMEYFHSSSFLEEVFELLNFAQFSLKDKHISQKDFFYAFCLLFHKKNHEDFTGFTQKLFLHYHTAFNTTSNIEIDYQALCHTLAKSQHKSIKESFGEENASAFFKIWIDDILTIEERGKRIKTLRKKAYKRLFFEMV